MGAKGAYRKGYPQALVETFGKAMQEGGSMAHACRACGLSEKIGYLIVKANPELRQFLAKSGVATTTHGMWKTAEWRSWSGMRQRCRPGDKDYANYGGRGIVVCDRWTESFENFYADMGPKPSPRHSLDRIDVNGHYEPGNCRWATASEQALNRRTSVMVEFRGEALPLKEWAQRTGIEYNLLSQRLSRGWSIEKALTVDPKAYRRSA